MSSPLRRVPAWTAAVLLLGIAAVALLDATLGGGLVGGAAITLPVVVAAYLTGATLVPLRAAVVAAGAAGLLTAANQLAGQDGYSATNDLFFYAVLVGGLVLAGELVSTRARQVRELRELAAVRAEQRTQELATARLEERTRLDAEVTRAMMQRLGALVVQATGVRRGAGPARDREAVVRIETGGRAALDELREVLGSLSGTRSSQEQPNRSDPVDHEDTEARVAADRVGLVDVLVGCSGIPVAVECLSGADARVPALVVVLATVATAVPLGWRRTRPLGALVGFFGLCVATTARVTPLTDTVTVLLPLSLAAFAAGAHTRGVRRWLGLGTLLAGGLLVALAGATTAATDQGLLPALAWLVLAWAAGLLTAQHADRATRLTRLLEHVEAGRQDAVRLAVAEQRQALARDLHDTVAHAMTLVCLHAAAAQQRWDDERAVAESLAVIESSVRDAMGRLRSGLGVLEGEHDSPVDLAADVHGFASSLGVEVLVALEAPLTDAERTLARRVVREALVNVARHAPRATAEVRVAREAGRGLVVEVRNDGAGPTGGPVFAGGARRGLTGLRELLTDHGGAVEHGPTDDGGYALAAYLPGAPAEVAR